MNIHEQIEKMRKIQSNILEFVDKENNEEEHFENIIQQIEDQNITANRHLLKILLYLLSKILNNHYRYPGFISKIEKIIQKYKTEIKNNFSSYEIYQIFKKNRRILLFLFKVLLP